MDLKQLLYYPNAATEGMDEPAATAYLEGIASTVELEVLGIPFANRVGECSKLIQAAHSAFMGLLHSDEARGKFLESIKAMDDDYVKREPMSAKALERFYKKSSMQAEWNDAMGTDSDDERDKYVQSQVQLVLRENWPMCAED